MFADKSGVLVGWLVCFRLVCRGGAGGDRYSFVACLIVVWPMTTHPFGDGAPSLLLVKTPATFGLPMVSSMYLRYCIQLLG